MDLLMTMGDIKSVDDEFNSNNATDMVASTSFVNKVPSSVLMGLVLFDKRYKDDPRPYKVIDIKTGRYLRGFSNHAEAKEFASNPRMCA